MEQLEKQSLRKEVITKIESLRGLGLSYTFIAKQLGMNYSMLHKCFFETDNTNFRMMNEERRDKLDRLFDKYKSIM